MRLIGGRRRRRIGDQIPAIDGGVLELLSLWDAGRQLPIDLIVGRGHIRPTTGSTLEIAAERRALRNRTAALGVVAVGAELGEVDARAQ